LSNAKIVKLLADALGERLERARNDKHPSLWSSDVGDEHLVFSSSVQRILQLQVFDV